jgi:hypothetical protein
MLPGPTIIRECPACNQYIKQVTFESGNPVGALFWTDGKMDAPMLPDQPWLVKCPSCKNLFWIDKARQLAELEPLEKAKKEFADALVYEHLTETDYLTFLQEKQISGKKEEYVRIRAWWCSNDSMRHEEPNKRSNVVFSQDQEDNISKLYELLDEKDPNQRIMKAEIARERSMFDEAMLLLEYNFPEGFNKVVSVIKELCKSHNAVVAEIKYNL